MVVVGVGGGKAEHSRARVSEYRWPQNGVLKWEKAELKRLNRGLSGGTHTRAELNGPKGA